MNKILVATDFSPPSINAVQTAHEIAQTNGSHLVLLWVQEPLETIGGEFGMPPPPPPPSDEEVLARLRALLPYESTVNADFVLAQGEPAEQIVRVAAEMGCDRIVMGAHQDHGWVSNLFHASVVEMVKRSATSPVIEVPPPATADV